MEVIRIPNVGLIDATGRNIGVYSDDPSWWQKLKTEQTEKVKEHQFDTNECQTSPIYDTVSDISMETQLIKKDLLAKTSEKRHMSKNTSSVHFKNEVECNVIGETPLHIAIMHDDLETLTELVEEKGYDVNRRSSNGNFSSGFNSKLTSKLISQSKYESLAYFGEYPLAFAACFSNKEIYDYLIEKGADPNLQG